MEMPRLSQGCQKSYNVVTRLQCMVATSPCAVLVYMLLAVFFGGGGGGGGGGSIRSLSPPYISEPHIILLSFCPPLPFFLFHTPNSTPCFLCVLLAAGLDDLVRTLWQLCHLYNFGSYYTVYTVHGTAIEVTLLHSTAIEMALYSSLLQ